MKNAATLRFWSYSFFLLSLNKRRPPRRSATRSSRRLGGRARSSTLRRAQGGKA